jgi:ferrous iron transport protein B
MERILGIPVLPISAAKNEGISELVDHALHVAKYQERPLRQDFCDKDDHGGAVHRCLHSIMHLIEDHAVAADMPLRFAATKVVEGDHKVLEALKLDTKELEAIEGIVQEMEQSRGLDRAAAIADMRFSFIQRLCRQTVVKPRESKEYLRSRRIDRVLTGKWTALPIFVVVMAAVIYLSIELLGGPLQGLLEMFFEWLGTVSTAAMTRWGVSEVVQSLVVDGVISGVGAVASFVPIIILLFFSLSLLEDSGYMARVAFVTDKLLRRLGLSGRSIVPLLVGFGCSVPAIMSSRTLSSRRDRKLTVLLIPFMSCSAKIPIYGFFATNFFPEHSWMITLGMYLLGIVVAVIMALIFKHIGTKSEAAPFVMELPNYRLPGAKNVGHLLWDKTKDFLQRAFTIIFLATIVIWFLQKFDFHFDVVENGVGSMLATIAGVIAPLFRPMGLDSWQVVTALVSGFMAKESVVMTLEVLDAVSVVTTLTAIPLVVFCLLYTPCVAAIATVKREQGTRMALFMVVFQCVVAWVVSYVAYLIASLFFLN